MATAHERLAASLEQLRELQRDGRRVFRSSEFGRVHRERLTQDGLLHKVIKGWLVSSNPGAAEGNTTPWYASFWEFCARYSDNRFGSDWHLSPEQSLLLHAENTVIPAQIVIYSPKGTNNTVNLLFGTSLYDLKQPGMPPPADLTVKDGIRLYSPAAALIKVPEGFFQRFPVEAQVALTSIRDASEVLGRLLEGGHSAIASRLAGAFRRAGRADIADQIVKTMKGAGYDVRESDPFTAQQKLTLLRPGIAPVVGRIRALWDSLRTPALEALPEPPGLPEDRKAYLGFVDEIYKSDAYHSLSIEGYTVTPELIERVRSGNWNPDGDVTDRSNRDALAARGYWQAFQEVKAAVSELIEGAEPGALVRGAHRDWYRGMFQQSVAAGLMRPAALAGYRSHPVYIRGSRHVPLRWETVPDAMTALFDLLQEEREPAVRAVLGHWMLGYIHPYPDGNGRMARFLMNAMLASGGYPWTVVRVENRDKYMSALEAASIDSNIRPFAEFVAERVQWSMKKAA
jgi:fido (protein-threonine AMPylation protein)